MKRVETPQSAANTPLDDVAQGWSPSSAIEPAASSSRREDTSDSSAVPER